MDRSWMYDSNRTSTRFIDGVQEFVRISIEHQSRNNSRIILCPCRDCNNARGFREVDDVVDHLIRRGFKSNYTTWTCHGERLEMEASTSNYGCLGKNTTEKENEDGGEFFEMDRVDELMENVENDLNEQPNVFDYLSSATKTELYPGCSTFTKLSGILKLFNLKAKHNWTDKSFTDLLKVLQRMLTKGNHNPDSVYEAKKFMCPFGMEYEKIHACPNDCILYRNEFKDLHECPRCGVSRYKRKETGSGVSKVGSAAKVLWHLPIIPRIKRLFADKKNAELLRWHADGRKKDGMLRHPADSPQWRNIDREFPHFKNEVRNLRLGLCTDGINPFGTMSTQHSSWPVLLTIYNLPPWLCMKRKFILMPLLISGPQQPGNDICVYLQPLLDELMFLWEEGVLMFDAYTQTQFTLRAMLFCTINDFPAYGNLSGYKTKGGQACPICDDDLIKLWLEFSGKNVYMFNRRLLPSNHPFRKMKKAFYGEIETREARAPLRGYEVYERVKDIETVFGKPYKGDKKRLWKKRSKLWDLPYWAKLDVGYLPSHLTSMSTGATSSVSSLPMRTNQWLLARSKFDGKGNLKLANEATERVKAEIDVWRHREKTGEFVPGRLDDVLSRALNKKDSRGRVLAIGGHVGIKSVWGPADRRGMHQRSSVGYEELEEIEERVSQRVRKQTMDEMNAKVDDLMKEKFIEYAQAMGMQVPDHMMKGSKIMSDPDANPKIRSSCNSAGHDPFEDLQGSANCRLAIILNGVRKVVATGFIITCFIASTKDNIKVSVDDYDKEFEDAPIPVHHESIQKLKHTQGAFLEWPKALVDLNDEEENPCDYCPKKKKKAKEVESGPQTSESALNVKRNPLLDMALENVSDQCWHMYEMVENLNGGAYYSIVATKHVFSYDEDQEVQVTYDDVTQLITGAWLNTSVLQVFIMDLYDWLESSAIESIGFMCPQMISETMIKSDPDGASRYMQQAIHRQQHKRFILGPYHERDHWILLVLSPSLRVVYIFDPIKKQRRNLKIKVQLQNAFRNYKFSQGSTTQRVLTWQQVDCAQQTGGRECAYYVMRYMLEIAQENYNSENLCADYVRTAPYSDEEIHEIRERFAEYFIGNIEGY